MAIVLEITFELGFKNGEEIFDGYVVEIIALTEHTLRDTVPAERTDERLGTDNINLHWNGRLPLTIFIKIRLHMDCLCAISNSFAKLP